MTIPSRLSGVLAPVVVPFDENLQVDSQRLIRQCRWLLSQNTGIAIFGTNSEANSLSLDEKIELLDALAEAGIDMSRLMPGTGLCAFTESVRLTAHAVRLGASGVLMLPPFYYKNVSDEGLYRSYAEIIERVGDERLRVYLYHIPPVSQIPISLPLIERLLRAYPQTVVGIKDSSGDWANTQAMLAAGWDDFRVFAGSETFLLPNMQQGGAGCISATANINPAAIAELFANWQSPGAEDAQAKLISLRELVQQYPVLPALKSIVAHYSGDDGWRRLRPPLVELQSEQQKALLEQLAAADFSMPGL